MAEKKVTTMVLNVDLQSSKCCNKVKKVLCKFPEIRDQTYDEKANKVTIKVVCCSPEKIRDKLCCKGRGCIKSIGIKEPEPEKPQPKPKPKPDVKEKKEPTKIAIEVEGLGFCCYKCYSGRPWGPCWCGERVLFCGGPVCDSWGGYGYRSGCGYYSFTEEYQEGCNIM